MSAIGGHNTDVHNGAIDHEKAINGHDHATLANNANRRRQYEYGGNPLAHMATNDSNLNLQAFGGLLQPGLYKAPKSNIANPAPLGLSAFALTTFVLSLINLGTRGVAAPNIVIALAYGYGGLVQLLAGMWEFATGNTFGATALSSYGGFWISLGILLTPSFGIVTALGGGTTDLFNDSFGFFLMGWFIFTFILLMCTLRSTVAFFLLFFTLTLAFLFLGVGHLVHHNVGTASVPNTGLIRAGGAFGILAAFLAWYNAFAGIADSSNSFVLVPVFHFPWSDKGREQRNKVNNADARAAQSV